MTIPDQELQNKALQLVRQTKSTYTSFCRKRKQELLKIYKVVNSFEGEKRAAWASAIKVNFAHQIENLLVARLTSKSPKFIVSLRQSAEDLVNRYYPVKELKDDSSEEEAFIFEQKQEERKKFEKEVYQWASAVQEYLNYAFNEYGFAHKFRQSAKAMVRYGNVYGMVTYRQEKFRKRRKGKVIEAKWREYPMIDIVSFSEMFLDPRYIQTADSPAVIRSHENVRMSELYAQENLINLDKIKTIVNEKRNGDKQEIYSIKIDTVNGTEEVQSKSLTIDKYQGFFSPDEKIENEALYEIWTVNGLVVIKMEEIPRIQIHSAGCFEDVEQHFSVGYLEPMLGLENEYNFKLNSAIEYINQSLNRSWFWDPNSGVNPKSLASLGPGSVIIAQKGMESATNGVQELAYRQIPGEYFANNNEIRRDIQTVSNTVDTTAPSQAQGFTNTATAVRARFFESNTVYADTLKHLEEFWTALAYDILDSIAENSQDDVVIANLGAGKFKWAKPEMFEDAPIRYAIQIEVGSSSFDSIENRREEALALSTLAKEARANGVNVDMNKIFTEAIATFEKKNPEDYILRDMSGLQSLVSGPTATQGAIEQVIPEQTGLDNPAKLTQDIVQGNLV